MQPRRTRAASTLPRLAAGAILGLAAPALPGCGSSEPQVTQQFTPKGGAAPKEAAKSYDPSGPLPKGMPKNTTAGLKIDPQTGRPVSQ